MTPSEPSDTQRARWESRVDAEMLDLRHDVSEVKHDIREMRDSLAGRPSWAIATIITTLTAACSVLATMVAITAGG